MIVRGVARGVEQRQAAERQKFSEACDCGRVLLECGAITPAEFLPSRRIMAEPLAQLRAWRDLFEPKCECGRLLAHAARPEPIHQHSRTVHSERNAVERAHRAAGKIPDRLGNALRRVHHEWA